MKQQHIWIVAIITTVISINIGCSAGKYSTSTKLKTIKQLRFLSEYIIPHNAQFQNTTVGGLSGIDYNRKEDIFYLISDDWSQTNSARFYTARIFFSEKKIDTVQFIGTTYLLQSDGSVYPGVKQNPYRTPDPESIRYNEVKNNLTWTSEGERYIRDDSLVLQDPAIRTISKEGRQFDSFPLPDQIHMYAEEKGLRRNGTFEGLSFANGFKNLYVSIEEPLYEDGFSAATGDSAAWVRIIKYDMEKKNVLSVYAYKVDPVVRKPIPANGHKINGVSEILEIKKDKILFVERSFSLGRTDCNIRIYIGDLTGATNVLSLKSLKNKTDFNPIKKTLLLNMDDLKMYIGNVEGVSFGPTLPNGHQTLFFVTDNNFRATEKTQFLLFEIIPV